MFEFIINQLRQDGNISSDFKNILASTTKQTTTKTK